MFYIDASTTIVQRANLLCELVDGIPQHRLHASKKLVSLDHQLDDSLLLHFADGSTHECDILIGANGVHSTVRKIILGDDPAAHARNTGEWVLYAGQKPRRHLCIGNKTCTNILSIALG